MTSTDTGAAWRPYLDELLYAIPDLDHPVHQEVVDRIVQAAVAQQVLSSPTTAYYDAAAAAVAATGDIARTGQDEAVVRDALTRIVAGLDAARPWPVHPYQRIDLAEWPTLAAAPVVGQVPLSRMAVQRKLRAFQKVGTGPDEVAVLLLELRTGQRVALRAAGAITAPGVDLMAHTDPASTVADFTELTGVPVDPA